MYSGLRLNHLLSAHMSGLEKVPCAYPYIPYFSACSLLTSLVPMSSTPPVLFTCTASDQNLRCRRPGNEGTINPLTTNGECSHHETFSLWCHFPEMHVTKVRDARTCTRKYTSKYMHEEESAVTINIWGVASCFVLFMIILVLTCMQFVPTLYKAKQSFVLQLRTKDYVQTYCILDTQSNVHCACQPTCK